VPGTTEEEVSALRLDVDGYLGAAGIFLDQEATFAEYTSTVAEPAADLRPSDMAPSLRYPPGLVIGDDPAVELRLQDIVFDVQTSSETITLLDALVQWPRFDAAVFFEPDEPVDKSSALAAVTAIAPSADVLWFDQANSYDEFLVLIGEPAATAVSQDDLPPSARLLLNEPLDESTIEQLWDLPGVRQVVTQQFVRTAADLEAITTALASTDTPAEVTTDLATVLDAMRAIEQSGRTLLGQTFEASQVIEVSDAWLRLRTLLVSSCGLDP
jgi:hypothetical protein